MYTFSNWTDEIAAVSEQYQNATVQLIDSSLVTYGTYDPVTNTKPVLSGDPVFWSGPARIIPPRAGTNRENGLTGNSSTQTTALIQFPKNANFGDTEAPLMRIKRGVKLKVTSCPDNPSLTTMLFVATSDFQGSNAASRSVEFSIDGDVAVS